MGGICGLVNCDAEAIPGIKLEGMLGRMMDAMPHRGKDGRDAVYFDNVGLGTLFVEYNLPGQHDAGPREDPETGVSVVLDGNFTNRDELVRSLCPERDAEDVSNPDIIARAYARWGAGFSRHLHGDYSLALWDARNKHMVFSRDPRGSTPLFYCQQGPWFAFSSEIKSLLTLPWVPREINERRLAHYLVYQFDERKESFLKGISSVEACHEMRLAGGEISTSPYWDAAYAPEPASEPAKVWAERVREATIAAVISRIPTKGKAGVMLSGGLDSSTIACIAARELRKQGRELHAFCGVLPEGHGGVESDERTYIDAVIAQEDNIIRHDVTPRGGPYDGMEEQVSQLCFPGHPYFYQHHRMYESITAEGITSCLDGEGGDHGISYDGYHLFLNLTSPVHWLKRLWWATQMKYKRRWAVKTMLKNARYSLLPEVLAGKAPVKYYESRDSWVDDYVLKNEIAVKHNLSSVTWEPNELLYLQALRLGGEGSMDYSAVQALHGLRVESPFWDQRLLDVLLAMPERYLLMGNRVRGIIRESMKGILPEVVRLRRDKGMFCLDYQRRLLNERAAMEAALERIEPDDPVLDVISPEKMRSQADRLSPGNAWKDWNMFAQATLSGGMWTIAFYRWFHGLPPVSGEQ